MLSIMYSNIQGVSKKKESLLDIMEEVDCDICLLAETMTNKVKIPGCRSVTSRKSIGQNVCVILRKEIMNEQMIKLYEPNEIANMIGIRFELMNSGIRIYTAHLKQQSTNTRDEIIEQFEELRKQFKYASACGEGIIMIFDANVHVGDAAIEGCPEKQDWGGKFLLDMIKEEGLVLMNGEDICSGTITRIDPRTGKGSCLDLVLVNQHVYSNVMAVDIDEKGLYKPANYDAKHKKLTDHNTILLKAKIRRTTGKKRTPYLNTKSIDGRGEFCQALQRKGLEMNEIFSDVADNLDEEFSKLMKFWNETLHESFEEIKPKGNRKPGIDSIVRSLMKEEKVIRDTVKENPERGRKIYQIRKQIHAAIACNRAEVITMKVKELREAKNPQNEIFKIRRERQVKDNLGFPLKDTKGVLQVSREGINDVVCDHFNLVFAQNPKPKGEIWQRYWKEIDELFAEMAQRTVRECKRTEVVGPTVEQIKTLINNIDTKKSVVGSMTGDLVKLGGDSLVRLIHRCIFTCFTREDIPVQMKIEKIVLLYKKSGEITDMDNYRGIFLRYLILSLLQKWLYKECAPIIDSNGSEYAFGGRTKRAVKEVLLVVKLVQDHARWTKRPLVLKFLDIKKFFDTMNFKTALIEAYRSGLRGKYWRIYKNINEMRTCTPYTPLGECGDIEVKQIFVQGSSDAMMMAWNVVDSLNKKAVDSDSLAFDPVCSFENVEIPRLGFVDDLLEMARSIVETQISCVSDEVFERQHRILYKPSKCKVMLMNLKNEGDSILLDGEALEIVAEHKYLGTLVSESGRVSDVQKRVKDSKGVLHEIVELCKTEALGEYRFDYMFTLLNSCFMAKFKHGCEVWDELNKKNLQMVNKLTPQAVKRILELPRSTPTNAVKHDFGLLDLVSEVELEKVLLTAAVMEMDDSRIVKRLLTAMMDKRVPGFCTQVIDLLHKYEITIDMIHKVKDRRAFVRGVVIGYEKRKLFKSMMMGSKTDIMLTNYCFNGRMMKYLTELPFPEGRIIFVFRCRMFPTRVNFPERWTSNMNCIYCGNLDTDEHLFTCWGFLDICRDESVTCDMFYKLAAPLEDLSKGAQVLIKIYNRLLDAQNDKDLAK